MGIESRRCGGCQKWGVRIACCRRRSVKRRVDLPDHYLGNDGTFDTEYEIILDLILRTSDM